MKCSKIPESQLVPISVIEAAMCGDPLALATVLEHFEGYINAMSTRILHDDYGMSYRWVDDELKSRIESRLIESIVKRFRIR